MVRERDREKERERERERERKNGSEYISVLLHPNREHTVAEYLTTVTTDPKRRRSMPRYSLTEHSRVCGEGTLTGRPGSQERTDCAPAAHTQKTTGS